MVRCQMIMPYDDILSELSGLFEGEHDAIANAANAAAVLWQHLPDINWAGFYFLKGGELVLGPFQGKPACIRIGLHQGVCGAAASRRESLVVADVHEFPGHIACDGASNAEIVVPLLRGDTLLGVLDIDSPRHGRFTEEDRAGCEAVARAYVASLA
ncbi:MAG: GAF domain-containing protein [Rhodospirillales bacterium]|nr:GAF domain-containing protein [Rhodospirillales bacterium]MDE2200202.1 GAF domain-containing protein [Rhodospirillales bacterium]MDE2576590.1 GAF domain-containing protein [Rhodospirillales bacterium]